MNLALVWSMPIDCTTKDAKIFLLDSQIDERVELLIGKHASKGSAVSRKDPRFLKEAKMYLRTLLLSWLSNWSNWSIYRFSWQTHVLFAYLIATRSLFFHRRFSPSFHFFFTRARSSVPLPWYYIPCPVTMIDRLCQDRAPSAAYTRFPGWRNDESGMLNWRVLCPRGLCKVSHAGINRSPRRVHVR